MPWQMILSRRQATKNHWWSKHIEYVSDVETHLVIVYLKSDRRVKFTLDNIHRRMKKFSFGKKWDKKIYISSKTLSYFNQIIRT